MVDSGVIANQYVRETDKRGEQDAVLIAPAYAFLISNTPVDYQFWLNIGSTGWAQNASTNPDAALRSQPPVDSRDTFGMMWTKCEANQQALYQLASGLIRRCRKRIYLGFSQYGEQGFEQRGALLVAIQSMLRRLAKEEDHV